MQMAPRMAVALQVASCAVWSDATVVMTSSTETHTLTTSTMTTDTHSMAATSDTRATSTSRVWTSKSATTAVIVQTGTETSSTGTPRAQTSTMVSTTSAETATVWNSTSTATSITTLLLSECLGDAGAFYSYWGNCSTYAPEAMQNYEYCYYDTDSDGLLAEEVCPECGLCQLGTSTTSAHTTTGTSTETSTTTLHTTTKTSSSTTPYTTTQTNTTTYTHGPCSRAFYAQLWAITEEGACTPVDGTCPMACRAVLENAIVACDGTKEISDGLFYPMPAGALISRTLRTVSEGACQEDTVDALLSSTTYTPSCLDGLLLLSFPIRACEGGGDLSHCPELCERVMDVAFDRCSAMDTIQFGPDVVMAEQLVGSYRAWLSPQCSAVLSTKAFLGAGVTSTAMADGTTAEEEWASTAVENSDGFVSSSSIGTSSSGNTMGTSSSGTTTGTSSSGISSGGSSASEEIDEILSSSHKSEVGFFVLWLANILMLM